MTEQSLNEGIKDIKAALHRVEERLDSLSAGQATMAAISGSHQSQIDELKKTTSDAKHEIVLIRQECIRHQGQCIRPQWEAAKRNVAKIFVALLITSIIAIAGYLVHIGPKQP